jgi:hypothetical protein
LKYYSDIPPNSSSTAYSTEAQVFVGPNVNTEIKPSGDGATVYCPEQIEENEFDIELPELLDTPTPEIRTSLLNVECLRPSAQSLPMQHPIVPPVPSTTDMTHLSPSPPRQVGWSLLPVCDFCCSSFFLLIFYVTMVILI